MYVGASAIAFFAVGVKKYSIVWSFAPYVPCWFHTYGNYNSQPKQDFQNMYKYILAKRAGTVGMERFHREFYENKFTEEKEFQDLKGHLRDTSKTLFELDQSIVSSVVSGNLK